MIDFAKRCLDLFLKNHCEERKNDFKSPCIYSKDCKQADGVGCTHPSHPTNVAKRREEEKAKEVHVEAYDESGNKFDKVVTFKEGERGKTVSFGWPCEYYVDSLLRDGPLTTDLCIDAGGRNHMGHAVYIDKDIVNALLDKNRVVFLKSDGGKT